MGSDKVQALVDEAANWAIDQDELHRKIHPLARHFAEVANVMATEVMIAMAKALETGIYLGKYGFPDERIPDAFKDAFKDDG